MGSGDLSGVPGTGILPVFIFQLAICADLFLLGVLCAQFAHYTNVNKRDSVLMKLFVAGLALLQTLKSAHALSIMWMQSFEVVAIGPRYIFVFARLSMALEGVITSYVGTFFCYRLWAISHNVYVVAAPVVLLFFALTASVIAICLLTNNLLLIMWIAIHLGVSLCADLLLTGSIVFYLLRHSKTVLPRGPTAPILKSLLWLTVQSAAPTTLCALINFVLPLTGEEAPSTVANVALPKLYAVSAMWTLNSREEISHAWENGRTISLEVCGTSGYRHNDTVPRRSG
ncbi:hypothetical protein B0H19DRAFT_316632 [Mycena capillaripes]|nr:hypothetical protein B0H19DRAFT_316632 [Mycena capillaripes]